MPAASRRLAGGPVIFSGPVALLDRDVVGVPLAGVDLARPGDLQLGSSFCSIHWATHPEVRGIAKITVNMSVGIPIAS